MQHRRPDLQPFSDRVAKLRPHETLANLSHVEGAVKLNHLNLTVSNVPETSEFLKKYFGLQPLGAMPRSEAVGFLTDDNSMVLALFRGKNGEVSYPPGFHIGFIQDSEERVNEINQRLQEDGFKVPKPARLHGSWTFYFQSPGGFVIEVLH